MAQDGIGKGVSMNITLSITQEQHEHLRQQLFPGDGMEVVAFALCGRVTDNESYRLLVQELQFIPYKVCERASEYVTWPTSVMPTIISRAENKKLSIVKIHSHTEFKSSFSQTDDKSDREYFNYLTNWIDNDNFPHASVIMFEDGTMIGRSITPENHFLPISCVKLVGDELKFWYHEQSKVSSEEFGIRVAQTFGEKTYQILKSLRIGVVGCSGTGSLVTEQLARNCVGNLVLIDPDRIEIKNLNRIPQATMKDAIQSEYKVDILEQHIHTMEFGTIVEKFAVDLYSSTAVKALSSCDVIFGCMDTIDGRHLLNKLASTYLIPYFDVGVKLIADGYGGIEKVCGTVHYLKPGGSSLLSRGVYTLEQLRATAIKHSDTDAYDEQLKTGYIEGVDEEKPAVISVNMLIASLGVNELLARIHPFRDDQNSDYAVNRFSLNAGFLIQENDGEPCAALKKWIGRGDVTPLLGIPSLSSKEKFHADNI